MPKHINSATRLENILTQTPNYDGNAQVMENWAKIFSINEQNPNKRAIQVSERLGWLQHELELVGLQMRQANFSENLYARALTNIENALSTMHLSTQWQQVKNHLQQETFVALAFCTEILPDEESEISTDDLSEIQRLVNELRESLTEASVSPRLRQLIEHHVNLIDRAITEYPIVGAKALREAARTGLGEFIEARDIIKEDKVTAEPQLSKLNKVWNHVNKATDFALKTEKLAELGQKAWDFLENMM